MRLVRSALIAVGVASLVAAAPVVEPRFRIEDRVRVREKIRPDAEVCLVHFHGNEVNAREVMLDLANTGCANALWLDDVLQGTPWGDDRIPVPSATSTTHACSVNPNRILTDAGFNVRIENDCDGDDTARRDLRRFLDETLLPALARCRGGARALPVVAFHNNSNLTSGDLDTSKAAPVVGREHDILLVTNPADYERLASLGRFTVALQSAPPADDGSLSVALQHDRYVNVEAQVAPQNKKVNREMGEWALRSLGGFVCGAGDWPAVPKK